MPELEVVEADLTNPEHAAAVGELINAYARDPMGLGRNLPDEVREALIPGLRQHPTTLVFLAYDGARAVGVAVCFKGFSTFAARPLVNVHDLVVLSQYRGRGVGRRLLEAVEARARALGCCKMTLEVLETNASAQALYRALGFAGLDAGEGRGRTWFLQKRL